MLGLFRIRSLAVKLSLLIFAITFLVGLVSVYLYGQSQKQAVLERAKVQLEQVARFKTQAFESYFSKHRQHVDDLANALESNLELTANADSWHFLHAAANPNAALTYLIYESKIQFAQPAMWQENMGTELDLDNNLFYSEIRDLGRRPNGGKWTPVFYDDVLRDWLLTYARPIYQGQTFSGVFASGVYIDPLIVQIADKYQQDDIEFFIHDAKGNIIYHPEYGARLLRQVDVMNQAMSDNKFIRSSLTDYIEANHVDGPVIGFVDWNRKIYAASHRVESNGWVVVAYRSEQSILKDWSDKMAMALGLSVGFIITLGLLILFLSRLFLVSRLKAFQHKIASVTATDFSGFPAPEGQDEVDAIQWQLNRWFEKFQLRYQDKASQVDELKEQVEANKALAQAVSFSDSAVILLELDYTIDYVDTKSLALLKSDRDALMGSRFFNFIHEHMAFISEQIVNEIRRKSSWHGELVLKDQEDGGQVWVNATITPMRDEKSRVTKYVVSMQDISFIKDSQSKIEKLAYTDELTNLANRTFFMAQLEKLVEISKRRHYEFALLYFDVDDFKRVNDLYGHDGGDQLLMELAARLSQHLRNEDVLARMGGDEFALIVGGATDEQDVLVIANAILAAVNEPFHIRGAEVQSGTSIGITMSMTDDKDAEVLLQHADMAMYEAKALGKNNFQFYTDELNEVAKERQVIETALRQALKQDRLELHYQPKVDFAKGVLTGFEALVRWQDPELGNISPVKFIPIAEQSNLIMHLGDWVTRKACSFAASLEPPVPVSINLSARQFESGTFVEDLRRTMEQCQVAPELIEVEITESQLMSDVEDAIAQLHAIKQIGVSISIDDFGTGYSSLSYLKRFPVDTLKIDRSFIKDIPDDMNDVEITGAIIAMAQKLGLEVIAEGAETQAQIDFLGKNGCYKVQGYFFSKPLPEEEARQWRYSDPEQAIALKAN